MTVKIAPFQKAPKSVNFSPNRNFEQNIRIYLIPLGIAFVFLVFFARLFHLTIVKGAYYQYIAENNRIREIYLEGKRGTLYDRKGRVLAESAIADIDDGGANIKSTAAASDGENSDAESTAAASDGENSDAESTVDAPDNEGPDTKTTATSPDNEKPDAESPDESPKNADQDIPAYTRTYSGAEALSHLLGYRQIASEAHLENDSCSQPLFLNDKVGVKGIEADLECVLRPVKGKRLVEVDSFGKQVRVLSQVEPKPGHDIELSIDSELQRRAYDILSGNEIQTSVEVDISEKKIAVVGLDPRTGEVLLLLSYPGFSPQDFEDQSPAVEDYLKDKDKPLFNRALLGTYPPGSVFKPVIAAGALEEHVISETDTIQDNGFIQAGPIRFHNWYYTQYGRTEGEVDLRKGLQRSNDIYFYKIGEKLTPEHIKTWAMKFGFGKRTGISLDDDAGLIPSDFWKRETIGDKWYLGDTYNLSIGQGYLLVTPLQVARSITPFANAGKMCVPQLLKLNSEMNAEVFDDLKPVCQNVGLSDNTIRAIREGMLKACEPGGTGWPLFNFSVQSSGNADSNDDSEESDSSRSSPRKKPIQVGCKTGTAESHGFNTLPHAWFTVFAPYDNPEIVLAILVEEGGEGSNVAAPIAKEILKAYFERVE